jgi:glyoxylase-like metal-dependent hydrolase (beta-lactamase superfamily II)
MFDMLDGWIATDAGNSILGHMHLDHAGGLDQFLDRTDIEIWVHDKELRSAFWSVATGADVGVYLDHYMNVSRVVAAQTITA